MVQDPLSVLDALMVALSGFVIVFIMLAVLWGFIVIVSRAVTGVEHHAAAPRLRPHRFRLRLHRQQRLLHRQHPLHPQRRRWCLPASVIPRRPA